MGEASHVPSTGSGTESVADVLVPKPAILRPYNSGCLYMRQSGFCVTVTIIHMALPDYEYRGLMAQARSLFERAGFVDVQMYSEFTFEPVKPADSVFVVSGHKPA